MSDDAFQISERDKKRLADVVEPLLIVDDSRTMLKILTQMLARLGMTEVIEASSAEAAFRLIRQIDVKMIICDIEMDGVSGWQLQNMLRAAGRTRHIPFVLMTTQMNPHYAMRAKSTAVSGFILKPFTARQLYSKIVEAAGEFSS